MMTIRDNVAAIREAISAAAKKSGRNANDIKIIGVTKNFGVEHINELLEAGITEIGENRVQEFLPKYEHFNGDANFITNDDSVFSRKRPKEWHFIGHLQRNKVRFIADKVDLIHSVDSEPLAVEINKFGEKYDRVINVLIEVNISQESSKFGIAADEILNFVQKMCKLRFIAVTGLMCVPPFRENAEENRHFFAMLQKKIVDINKYGLYDRDVKELSMGMSSDFTVAIEEGATMIRLGTALLGTRLLNTQQ